MLTGLLVVEVGQRRAVRVTGGLLAELGADVVVLEAEGGAVDQSRGHSMVGKRSVLPFADPQLAEELLQRADVVLISSDQGVSAELPPRQEGQVVCDITAFGSHGPWAGLSASDQVVQAISGVAWVNGSPSEPPRPSRTGALDMEAAVFAASGIVAALLVRNRSGAGQYVEIALHDVAINALGAFLPLPFSGGTATRAGNRHPILAPWNTYPTSDGWVMLCAPSEDQWRRLCRAMGAEDLAEDSRFASSSARLANLEAVDAVVGSWTSSLTGEECLAVLSTHNIPSGPILELGQLGDEPNVRHRQMIERLTDPVQGLDVACVHSPVRMGSGRRWIPQPHGDAEWARMVVQRTTVRAREPEGLAGPALHGLRVVEIGMNTVAPLAGRQLGALGADVVKVEPPSGDVNRVNAPLRPDGEAYIFAISNTDKRGVVLDLRQPEDADRLRHLLESADVLIENLKPGSLDRLGFSAADVRSFNPALIYCSMSGFGHDSAYPGRPALDTVIQSMSGIMAAESHGGMPTKIGISIADQLGGQFGLLAVLSALLHRDATGEAIRLDVAMHDAAVWVTQHLWAHVPDQSGATRVLPVADGYVVVDGLGDEELARALKAPVDDLAGVLRDSSREALTKCIGVVRGQVKVAPIHTVEEALETPHTRARRLIVERPTVDGDSWQVMESPLRLSRTPARVLKAMPRLGVVDLPLATELGLLPDRSVATAGVG